MIAGLVVLIPSGLCTGTLGYLTIVQIAEGQNIPDALSESFILIAISGLSLAGTIFLIHLGLRGRKTK